MAKARQRFPVPAIQPFETWQVAVSRLPVWLHWKEGDPRRAWAAFCLSPDSGQIQVSNPGYEEDIPSLLESVLALAGQKWRSWPARVQVGDAALAPLLEGLLASREVPVELLPELPVLERAVSSGLRHVAPDDPRPGLLSGEGVTLERVAAFARAAEAFYAASGWRHLSLADRIRIESPEAEADLRDLLLVHSRGNPTVDLRFLLPGLFPSGEEDFGEDPEEETGADQGSWNLELCLPWDSPSEDLLLWERHGLPMAGGRFIPAPLFFGGDGFHRPDHRQLAFFEGLFNALAATSEGDLDTGRWEKRVTTAEGPVRYVLSLPALLEMPLEEILADLPRREVPEERAMDLVSLAFQIPGRHAVLLARQALKLWPDCVDVYNLLAGRAPDPESAIGFYHQALAAGLRRMEPDAFDDAGFFWGLVETRPYMRARAGLAETLARSGRLPEAVEHFQEMLRLNPNDNQGARYELVNHLIRLDRDAEALELLERYGEEDSPMLEFPRALLAFRRDGDSLEARRVLKRALQSNRFVSGMLLGKRLPQLSADFYRPGDENEAGFYFDLGAEAWVESPGALDWLRKRTALPPRARKGKSKRKKRR